MCNITIIDKIAFKIIRFGFQLALKNNSDKSRLEYGLNGDTYVFESALYKLTKTNEIEKIDHSSLCMTETYEVQSMVERNLMD